MNPLRIAILTSRALPGLDQLLADPNRGSTWVLSIVVGSETQLEQMPMLEGAGVPVELRPIRQRPAFRNLHVRAEYDDETGELLQRLEIDYVLLAGYDYVVTEALLARAQITATDPFTRLSVAEAMERMERAGKGGSAS